MAVDWKRALIGTWRQIPKNLATGRFVGRSRDCMKLMHRFIT
jgi:hypothetical protein